MDRSYKYFIGVVQAGNISKAAKKMRISQPALSASLKSLESHLKTELLVRSRRGVALTEQGKFVYEQALGLADIEKNILSSLQNVSKKGRHLDVGAIDSIALDLVGHIDPKSDSTQITVDNTSRLVEQVRNGQLDIAYVTKPTKEFRGLKYETVANEDLVAVAAKHTTDSLIPLLAYNSQSNTHKHIVRSLHEQGFSVKTVMHSTDPHLLIEAARLGRGVAIIPVSLYNTINDPELIEVYQKLNIKRPIARVSRQNRLLSETIQSFEDKIANTLS